MSSTEKGTTSTEEAATRPPVEPVAHFTVAERAARGRAARADVPRRSHASWEPSPGRADPVELLEEQAEVAGGGARADPLRADARLAVHVLPRRRRTSWPPISPACRGRACTRSSAATRTSRTSADLRRAGPAARVRHQRLRRDAARARSSGISSGSSRASRSPAATAASTTRRRQPINLAVTRSYREAMAEFASMRTFDSGTRASTSRPSSRAWRRR